MGTPKGTETQSPVALDLGLCKACGICMAICPEHVFDTSGLGEPIVARPEDCTSCLLCELHCPDFAIEIRRRVSKRPAASPAATPEEIAEAEAARVFAALAAQSEGEGDSSGHSSDRACGHHDEDG